MSGDVLAEARDAEADYRWTKRLIANVYSHPRPQDRRTVAHLFVGEWVKHLEAVGAEARIRFRGGEGYIDAADLSDHRVLEIYFIDVGQGDAILIQTPDDARVLIDGGKDRSAHSFLRWKYRLDRYFKDFDAVIMTHGDADHAGGLIPILNDSHVLVKDIYHNGIAKRGSGLGRVESDPRGRLLVDLYDAMEDLEPTYDQLTPIYRDWHDAVNKATRRAARQGMDATCHRVDQHTSPIRVGGPGGLEIEVLAPINLGTADAPRLMTFGAAGKTINGNSVSVLLKYGDARILLCGDMNAAAEKLYLAHREAATLRAHVFKASHHGSQDFTTPFLDAVKPWITVVSSGDQPDYGHPRANLLGSLGHAAPPRVAKPLLFSTEIAATFKKIPDARLPDQGRHVYEKTTHGLINVRTDGRWLAAGRVYGRAQRQDDPTQSHWKWEAYAFNLTNADPLTYTLLG